MKRILKLNPDNYFKNRTYINQNRSNIGKQPLHSAIQLLTSVISQKYISVADSQISNTMMDIVNTPYSIIKTCKQQLNTYADITNIPDITNLSENECIQKLNLFHIKLPFSRDTVDKVIDVKLINKSIPAKGFDVLKYQKYVNNVAIYAIYEDQVKFNKEISITNLNQHISSIINEYDNTDMSANIVDITDYDISSIVYSTDQCTIIKDSETGKILESKIQNHNQLTSKFENLFNDTSTVIHKDVTFINYDQTTLESYIDISSYDYTIEYNNLFNYNSGVFKENMSFDNTIVCDTMLVPCQSTTILPGKISKFISTIREQGNEQINPDVAKINYGSYVYGILRTYYGFDSNLSTRIMQLILAQVIKNYNEDPLVSEVNKLIRMVAGFDRAQSIYADNIVYIETEIKKLLPELETKYTEPVKYIDDTIEIHMDLTTDITYSITDIYSIINSLNTLSFLYVIDFGQHELLSMQYLNTQIQDKSNIQKHTAYITAFFATNKIYL